MEGFTNFYGLTTPIEVVNPTSSIDKFYGPYNTMAEALVEMGIIGKPGRLFGVFIDDLVQLYIYQGITTVPTPAGRTDFIPLNGTETNSPITGDLEFEATGDIPFNILYSGDKPDFFTNGTFSTSKGSAFLLGTSGIQIMSYDLNIPEERVSGGAIGVNNYTATIGFLYVSEYTNGKDEANNIIDVTADGIKIHCSPFNNPTSLPDYLGEKNGLYSNEDLSTATGNMSYVQKFWVRAYVGQSLEEADFIPLGGTAPDKYASGDVNIEDIWTTRYQDGSSYRSVGQELLEEYVEGLDPDGDTGIYHKSVTSNSYFKTYDIFNYRLEETMGDGGIVKYARDKNQVNEDVLESEITTRPLGNTILTSSTDNKGVVNTHRIKTTTTGIKATAETGVIPEGAYMGYEDDDIVTMKRFRNMPYSITWNTPSIQFNNLPDKSTDATYNLFMGMDSNGNIAKFENAYNMLHKCLSTMTQTQALTLGQLLNGGQGSAGAMSVNTISPSVAQLSKDEVTYVTLRGANLAMNVTSFSLEIINSNDVIVATIPNAQVVESADPTTLRFYYNFKDLPNGDYRFKITNGAKVLITNKVFQIITNIEYIVLNNITWEVIKDTNYPDTYAIGEGGNIDLLMSYAENIQYNIVGGLSSVIFNQGENFSIEFTVTYNNTSTPLATTVNNTFSFGLVYSDTSVGLIDSTIFNIKYNKITQTGARPIRQIYNMGSNTPQPNTNSLPQSYNIIVKKTGNYLEATNTTTNITTSTTIGNNQGYRLAFYMKNHNEKDSIQVSIQQAFKFN